MYIYNFISILNHIWTFVFKRMLTSLIFFFSLIKTHISHLIQFIIIKITLQKFWCFMIDGTYFFGFSHSEFIHHIFNNSVVLLFLMEPFSRYEVASEVLSRMGCIILSFKFSQDLTLIRRMPSAIDHTDFWCAHRSI